ncbi:vomeronasal type-2 receptor 26-like [Pleurodeles waltl]|uniref:vomeronasal type-2 receptor 26-like n=1 Tax=Pleurodeles waltl TaxID=8319 RepID=UPI003709B3DD
MMNNSDVLQQMVYPTDTVPPKWLLNFIRKVFFTNSAGEKQFFDQNGDPPALYDILNWQLLPDGTTQYVKIGTFDSSLTEHQPITVNDSAIVWSRGYTELPRSVCSENCPPGHRRAARLGYPNCCFDCLLCSEGEITNNTDAIECVKCLDHQWSNEVGDKCIPKPLLFLSYNEPLGAALVIVCAICSAITLSALCIFRRHRDTPIVKANNRALSFLLLVSLNLCFLCSIMFIGKPKRVTCVLRQVIFTIVFTICISTILAKTITVVIAFNATRPGSIFRKWVKSTFPFYLLLLCSIPQVVICIFWLVVSPPFVELNMKNEIGTITIECNEGSLILFYGALGYLGLLSSISFVVAFIARKLPNSFNEAKMITFSMLVFCSVWILFIPTYLSTKGKYIVAEEIFAIQASSAGLLCCIFFPKLYIILLKPERNSKEYLIKKIRVDHGMIGAVAEVPGVIWEEEALSVPTSEVCLSLSFSENGIPVFKVQYTSDYQSRRYKWGSFRSESSVSPLNSKPGGQLVQRHPRFDPCFKVQKSHLFIGEIGTKMKVVIHSTDPMYKRLDLVYIALPYHQDIIYVSAP